MFLWVCGFMPVSSIWLTHQSVLCQFPVAFITIVWLHSLSSGMVRTSTVLLLLKVFFFFCNLFLFFCFCFVSVCVSTRNWEFSCLYLWRIVGEFLIGITFDRIASFTMLILTQPRVWKIIHLLIYSSISSKTWSLCHPSLTLAWLKLQQDILYYMRLL